MAPSTVRRGAGAAAKGCALSLSHHSPTLLPQSQLIPNNALTPGLHLHPHGPGKDGSAGLGKDHTRQLLIAIRLPVPGFSSLLSKQLLITNKLVFVLWV